MKNEYYNSILKKAKWSICIYKCETPEEAREQKTLTDTLDRLAEKK